MSEHRWEERVPRFAEDHMLTGKLVSLPSPSKAAWMLKAFPPGQGLALGSCPGSQAEGTTNLPTPAGLCQQHCPAFSSHALFSTAATSTWAETKNSRSKRKANPRDSWRDTERPTGYILSLGSLFFSLSFMTVQFLSPQQRTKLLILLTEREEIRGSHIPMHPSRKKNHCLRSLFFQ